MCRRYTGQPISQQDATDDGTGDYLGGHAAEQREQTWSVI